MKIAILTELYAATVKYLYETFPSLSEKSFLEQKEIIDSNASIWSSGWEDALVKHNIEVLSIPINLPLFLANWRKEINSNAIESSQIILDMLNKFMPDILLYDNYNLELLHLIKNKITSIKRVILWSGSAIANSNIFNHVDLVLSCAPETVKILRQQGKIAEHLNHAFNKRLLSTDNSFSDKYNLIFIGQIYRAIGFHMYRDKMLKEIVRNLDLKIFSSAYELGLSDFLHHLTKKSALTLLLPVYFLLDQFSDEYSPKLEKAKKYPFFPYSLKLKKSLRPTVYGKKMYDVIRNSKIVLNIHADSSPLYASNMRLFETTGVGSCLLTDWKENINELFKEGEEIVTYRNTEECIEKAKWLLEHDQERESIALKGQQRTFSSHLYKHRVPEFLTIIKKHLM